MKLKAPFAIWLLLLLLLPALPLFGFWAYTTYGYGVERRAAVEARLVRQAETIAEAVNERINVAYGYTAAMATSDRARAGDVGKFHAYAQRVQEAARIIEAFTFNDSEARMLFLTRLPFGETYPSTHPELIRSVIETGKPRLSGVVSGPVRGIQVVTLGVPVITNDGSAYVLRAVLSSASLSDILRRAKVPPDWIVAVVDSSGKIVARSHSPELHVGKDGSPQLLAAMQRKEMSLWPGVTVEGVATLTALRPVGSWGWHLAIGAPSKSLSDEVRREILLLGTVGLGILAASIAAVLGLSRHVSRSLRETVEIADAVLQGRSSSSAPSGVMEVDQMRSRLTEMDRYSKLLAHQVDERTAALRSAQERAASFATRLEESVEWERRRIAREVHDQIGAAFTGIRIILVGLAGNGIPASRHKALMEAVESGLQTSRRIAAELRPPLLDDLGLGPALELLLEQQLARHGIHPEVELHDQDGLSEQQRISCYRIVQEACTNVLRHAAARNFRVRGASVPDGEYQLSMSDDGRGMAATGSQGGSLGLQGMQERAELLGGTLHVGASSEGGVLLTLRFPLQPQSPVRPDEIPDR